LPNLSQAGVDWVLVFSNNEWWYNCVVGFLGVSKKEYLFMLEQQMVLLEN
jgi:hypothetical protein